MKITNTLQCGCLVLLAVVIGIVQPTCVLESDFGFKINCAFKKSGLFRVRNLGGLKAHASLGFSLGDELGFEQSLTNLDPSRRRSVNVKNGVPRNDVSDATPRSLGKQEKRAKQNRIMMRPPAPPNRPNQAAMEKLSSLHRHATTMHPIIVGPTIELPTTQRKPTPTITMAKPMPMGVPAFKPLPPKDDLRVLPLAPTTKKTPVQLPLSKGPGLIYQSEKLYNVPYQQQHYNMMPMTHNNQLIRITPTPIIINTPKMYSIPTTVNPFFPIPVAAPPTQMSFVPAQGFKDFYYQQGSPKITNNRNTASHFQKTFTPISNFVDTVPQKNQEHAIMYNGYNTKKVDDYNSITGYGDDTTLMFNKEDINAKIAEIAKAGNISMEAVEAAIALRQQQLLNKYASIPIPSTTTTTTTTTTEAPPIVFQTEPEPETIETPRPSIPKRQPTSGKVMNAPREYYPVGYEKNFDDEFQSKVDLPDTTFHCGDQKYFPGLYGDEGLGCMVFHVCALTDDGLVMKSFLCPESTLFDQTILKCNWWFYVDCKSTRSLYDTNIPVSKSYQLMKALTFFSSYKKEIQEDANRQPNPEDMEGVKEAISILENQNSKPTPQPNTANAIHIITPATYVDERNNYKQDISNETSPVYRSNRNYRGNSTRRAVNNTQSPEPINSSEFKVVRVNAGFKINNEKQNSAEKVISSENATSSSKETVERKHRRKLTLRSSNTTTKVFTTTTTIKPTEATTDCNDEETTTAKPSLVNKQEKLVDQLENTHKIDSSILKEAENSPPVRRFYRSSAENTKDDKEITIVKNEKIQIIRPTSTARLVGEFQTPTATIAKLDEAILGKTTKSKREAISIVKPVKQDDFRSITNRDRT